ncbi:MAG TPA: hypothetical protein VKR56_10015 [Candidatus Cybelea sp.]|nr:hypothetical protein [Candidatus Cybelea sp.]
MATSRRKIDTIYELRKAAESKALAEKALEDEPGAVRRDQLLHAQIKLEEKTIEAIEVCHECGLAHSSDGAHEKKTP